MLLVVKVIIIHSLGGGINVMEISPIVSETFMSGAKWWDAVIQTDVTVHRARPPACAVLLYKTLV